MLRRLAWTVLISTVVVSCSGPPTPERQQAEGALTAARAADAGTYARAELTAAEMAIAQYDAAVAQRDYRQALRLALEARDGAYVATKRAGDEKAAARSRAEHLASNVAALIHAADARAAQAGVARSHADQLRAAVKSSRVRLQEARSAMTGQDYLAAIRTLTTVEARLRTDLEAPSTPRRAR